MGHATIYADQECVLDFVHERLEAGDDDLNILRAGRSCAAIVRLGHAITDEDLSTAVHHVQGMLADDSTVPRRGADCIGYLRRVFAG